MTLTKVLELTTEQILWYDKSMETTVKTLTLNIAPFNLTVGGALLGANMTDICNIDGCNNGQFKGNMCHLHYYRKRNNYELTKETIYDPRHSIIDGDIAKIPLGVNAKDGYAIVDKEFAYLDKYKWQLNSAGYAITSINKKGLRMHRIIFGATDSSIIIDHKDRDTKNNRIDNLRIATSSQNNANSKVRSDSSTGFKGVFRKKNDKYFVRCRYKGVTHGGGKSFANIYDAIKRYNELALKYHGEFAYLNNVRGDKEIK